MSEEMKNRNDGRKIKIMIMFKNEN